jgi:predicted amidohydrolase YtcJ
MKHEFAVVFAAALLLSACSTPPAETPGTLYTNATVWTGTGQDAEAFVVVDDRLAYVGPEASAPRTAETIDLGGAFVVPGFIDNHTHFLQGGMQLASVDLRDAATPQEFARRLGEFAATQPAGRWILGGDWDHELWGGELPAASWVDALTPDNPVFVSRLDGHMAMANTVAIDMAGLTASTADAIGGTVVRGKDGSPTGLMKDAAMSLIYRVIPDPTLDERVEALNRAMEHAVSRGVTQVHDVGTYGGWLDQEAYRAAEASDQLVLRIYNIVSISTWQRLAGLIEREGRGSEWLRWGGVKAMIDGSLGSTTAWFYDPYLDEPGTAGLTVTDTTLLRQQILDADAAGLQLAVHAIGDRANDWVLDVMEDAAAVGPARERRPRIEHAQHLSAGAVGRFAPLGVVPSMQPYHAVDDGRWAENRIGPKRARLTYAFRSLLDAGATMTFGSDWTVAPIDPLLGIHAAVTRATIDGLRPDGWIPEQKISVEEALRAYTYANAFAGWQEEDVGTIEAGKLADFVVLAQDLRAIDPEAIPGVAVLRTVVGGETMWVAPRARAE